MPFWIRVICGVLGFVFLIWTIVGLFPMVPGGIVCLPISILFFKLAKIPFFSRFVGRISAPLLFALRKMTLWVEKRAWGIQVRVRIARFVKWLRSKREKPD
jgi:hypothetical protein